MALALAIIADDLTGALDTAAPFAGRGLHTVVSVDGNAVAAAVRSGAEVVAVNTASREVPAIEARERVAAALSVLPPGTRLFKKVDSRLKGNIEAELSAFPSRRLAILPAIPEFGRIVEGGAVRGFGIDAPIAIAPRLGALAERSIVPDVRTPEDMRNALRALDPDTLLVGARGLADALARSMTGRTPGPVRGLGQALVMAIGSRDPITLGQIAALEAQYAGLCLLEAPNGALDPARELETVPRLTLLQAIPGAVELPGPAVARALAQSLQQTCLEGRDGLLISGGATAEVVLAALGHTLLEVAGEIVDGLPVSRAGGLSIITKSGGFGKRDALVDVARAYFQNAAR